MNKCRSEGRTAWLATLPWEHEVGRRQRAAPRSAGRAERSIDDRLRCRPVRRGEGLYEIAFAADEHAAEIGELAESFDSVVASEAAEPDGRDQPVDLLQRERNGRGR